MNWSWYDSLGSTTLDSWPDSASSSRVCIYIYIYRYIAEVNARDMQRIVEFVLHDRAMLWRLAKVASIFSISAKKLLGYAYTVKRVRRHTTHTSSSSSSSWSCHGKWWIVRVRRIARRCCRCSCENPSREIARDGLDCSNKYVRIFSI